MGVVCVMHPPCPQKNVYDDQMVESSLRRGGGSAGGGRYASWFKALCFRNVDTTVTKFRKHGRVCKQSDLI